MAIFNSYVNSPEGTRFKHFVPQNFVADPKASLIHDKLPRHFATRIKDLGRTARLWWIQYVTGGLVYDPPRWLIIPAIFYPHFVGHAKSSRPNIFR